MFHAIRTRINATTLVAVLALVFAMTGGAYAAKKYLITSTKQISPSVLKSLRGKAGANGAPGPAGTAGPQGAPGAAGAKGDAGVKGDTGSQGEQGPKGDQGEVGSPWTAGGTLPLGSSETGSYIAPVTKEFVGVLGFMDESETQTVPVSFIVPLSSAPSLVYVLAGGEEEFGADAAHGCPGVVNGIAKAASGKFCVYAEPASIFEGPAVTSIDPGAITLGTAGVARSGAVLKLSCGSGVGGGHCFSVGLWAVTG